MHEHFHVDTHCRNPLAGLIQYLVLVDEEHTDEDMDEISDMFRLQDRCETSDSESSDDQSDDDDDSSSKPSKKRSKDRFFSYPPQSLSPSPSLSLSHYLSLSRSLSFSLSFSLSPSLAAL